MVAVLVVVALVVQASAVVLVAVAALGAVPVVAVSVVPADSKGKKGFGVIPKPFLLSLSLPQDP